jgi:hypothetical protein
MNNSLMIAQDIFKVMAFLLVVFIFARNIRSELE